MYLTKLTLNMKNAYVVRNMANCEWIHKLIMERGFGHIEALQPRNTLKVLYALDDNTIYVQSAVMPRFMNESGLFIEEPRTLQIDGMKDRLKEGMCVRVRCTCNPTYHDESGKRRFIGSEEKRDKWFRNVMDSNGAEVLFLSQTPESTVRGIKKDKNGRGYKLYAQTVTYTGALKIKDGERFWKAFCDGIGKEKAYGCGMLLVTK